jgi:hypothetical protein
MISHGPPAFVIDSSRFPLPQQAENARGSRRIGLGITGLADALVMLGLTYGSEEPLALAGQVLRVICHAAYRAFIRSLPEDIQEAIARTGIRQSSACNRAHGDDQPVGRQCFQRIGAYLRPLLCAQRAGGRRRAKAVHAYRLCARSVAAADRLTDWTAARLYHRRRIAGHCPYQDAGGIVAVCR